MKSRGPNRIESRPTRGERKNITTVTGTVASPLRNGEYPASCCRKSDEEEALRRERRVDGERLEVREGEVPPPEEAAAAASGCGARCSQSEESREERDPAEQRDEDQRVGEAALRRLDQREHRAGEAEHAERRRRRSRRARAARVAPRSGIATATSAIVTSASGTLIRKIERQEATETSQPPTSGPIRNAMPGPGRPGADRGAALLALKATVIVASAAGVSSAPATPCRPRATISDVPFQATAQRSEVTPNATTPITNTRFAAEEVAERAADEDQRAEREQVGVDDPLLEREAAAEVALDRRQRDVDDRRVDEHDRRPEDAGDERQPLAHPFAQIADTSVAPRLGETRKEAGDARLHDRRGSRRSPTCSATTRARCGCSRARLGSEQVAFTYRRMPQHTGGKGSYGHRHKRQEEIYFVVSGKLQFKLERRGDRGAARARRSASRPRSSARSGTRSRRTPSS